MELCILDFNGKIRIPDFIIEKLNLKKGDKVCFSEEDGKIIFQTEEQQALLNIQKEVNHSSSSSEFKTEEDVVEYIKKMRQA